MLERRIYEIAQQMSDRDNIEKDMEEAMAMVTGMFRDKYINRLYSAFGKCRDNCMQNPPKEVCLINALKPFMPEQSRGQLDKMAEMMIIMETMNNINKEGEILASSTAENIKPNETHYDAAKKTDRSTTVNAMGTLSQAETISSGELSQTEDAAIHKDGIYEVDKNCMFRRGRGLPTNMMSIMLATILADSANSN